MCHYLVTENKLEKCAGLKQMTSVSLQEIFLRKAQHAHSFVTVAMGFHPVLRRIKRATRSPSADARRQYLDWNVRRLQRSVAHKMPALSPWWWTRAKHEVVVLPEEATSNVDVIKAGDKLENFLDQIWAPPDGREG